MQEPFRPLNSLGIPWRVIACERISTANNLFCWFLLSEPSQSKTTVATSTAVHHLRSKVIYKNEWMANIYHRCFFGNDNLIRWWNGLHWIFPLNPKILHDWFNFGQSLMKSVLTSEKMVIFHIRQYLVNGISSRQLIKTRLKCSLHSEIGKPQFIYTSFVKNAILQATGFFHVHSNPVSEMLCSPDRTSTIYSRIYRSIQKSAAAIESRWWRISKQTSTCVNHCTLWIKCRKPLPPTEKKHAPRISFRYTSERVLRCMLCKSARVSQTMPIYSDRIMHIARLGAAEIVPAHTHTHSHVPSTHLYIFRTICRTGRLSMQKPSHHCTSLVDLFL